MESLMRSWPSILVPIITSFKDDGEIFTDGTKNVISFLSEQGINGIWLLGSYGSFPLLTNPERLTIATLALRHAKTLGMTTIVNVGTPSTALSIELAKHAESEGADAVAAVVPFYYASTHYRNKNHLAFFEEIVRSVDIPVIFYNNADATGFSPSNSFIEQLVEAGVAGMKDKGDFAAMSDRCRAIRHKNTDAIYLSGATSVHLQGHLIGADGVTSGTALAVPDLVVSLQDALDRRDMTEAVRLQNLILKVRIAMGRYAGRAVSAYDALEHQGVNAGTCRSPWLRLSPEEAVEVIEELDVLVAAL
jgi:dihydrodipicolinate synthase/N-acetylneuraminate lyase|tara:strand:- start:101 stop:1015 length:915 start_codon:yes stop_codon:yes gene_type:complete